VRLIQLLVQSSTPKDREWCRAVGITVKALLPEFLKELSEYLYT
jgi:hypothetical protein